MSLDKEIQEQYHKRMDKSHLYNSVYSILSDQERHLKVKEIMKGYADENKTILEIGAGQGSNVPLLLECGFSLDRIFLNELLQERIASAKAKYPSIVLYEGDALKLDITQKFDCVFQSTVFTSILDDNDRQKLAGKMWELLKPGGVILWYDFIYNNPKNPDVKKVSIPEVKKLFPKALRHHISRITLAPPVGRLVGKLYPLFNVPFLRSHILAVFQKGS